MRWLAKSITHRAISVLPWKFELNYVLQRRVSRRVPLRDSVLMKKAGWARRHLVAVDQHVPLPLADISAYEFGGGWDLVGPLCFWAAGINRQTVIDVAPHLRVELVNHSLRRMAALRSDLEVTLDRPLRPIPSEPIADVAELRSRFGISYLSPVDARATGFASGCFDFISSSDTLEHVPASDLVPILTEGGRLLSPDGVMSHLVDMMDHYRYVDPSITVYNFLKFSSRRWRLLNSPMEPQNRLRLPDYRQLVQEANLVIRDEEVRWPTDADREKIAKLRIADEFTAYSVEDLGAKSVRFTASAVATASDARQTGVAAAGTNSPSTMTAQPD